MTSINHKISPAHLEAVALAASTEQTRYYLCGVCIEKNAGIIATDGHRLHSVKTDSKGSTEDNFIFSNEDIKRAISLAKGEIKALGRGMAEHVHISLDFDTETQKIIVKIMCDEMEKASFSTKAIDGSFPDWRRVVPSAEKQGAIVIGFNPNYVADFGKAAKMLTGMKYPQVNFEITDKDSPVIVSIPGAGEFTGVLMPMRV